MLGDGSSGWLRAAAVLVVVSLGACSGDGEGDLVAFCDLATDEEHVDDIFEDLHPDDVDEALATFRSARETQRRLRAVAPEAARADIETVASFVDSVIDGLEEADPTSPDPPEVYTELRPRFDEVEAASQRLDRYVDSNCR